MTVITAANKMRILFFKHPIIFILLRLDKTTCQFKKRISSLSSTGEVEALLGLISFRFLLLQIPVATMRAPLPGSGN